MIELPAFFNDGMVIGLNARIWGWAEPGRRVVVEFLGERYEAEADCDGRFEVTVKANGYGGPYTMRIAEREIKDVYVGRVWLCGGQSNMETPLGRVRSLLGKYIADDGRIRVFQGEKGLRFDGPSRDIKGEWRYAQGEALESMYAVPYFFARALLESDPSPIGLICVPAGGTPIEGWLPEEIIRGYPALDESLRQCKQSGYIKEVTEKDAVRIQKWHGELEGGDPGLSEGWHRPDYNDAAWDEGFLTDSAEMTGHGSVWFRKRVTLPENIGSATLCLGRAINSVRVYVNGEWVHTVDYMYPPCTCAIPEGLLKPGENLIAVRVVGDALPPSFVPGKRYALEYSGGSVDLNGPWKRCIGKIMPKLEPGSWFYNRPCGVYNAMLAPVLGCTVDGMIWYQGESNVGNPRVYKELFTAFAGHVRSRYDADLPIVFTQLANYIDPNDMTGENWAVLREQQRQCLSLPDTAMAVTIDCGEWNDLHPLDKKTVGNRLALCARRLVYYEDIVSDGPVVKKAEYRNGELTIRFNHANGLWAKNGRPLIDVIDESGNTHRFYAEIKGETLTARIPSITIKRIRFGWSDCPPVTLYNAYNLPASPFEIEMLPVKRFCSTNPIP
ncbi:MAG: sialate O-acetylesterase [Defluviitaleaceae bacterium]|nr:sialate O-acetylesterase [Defluviitaleaceae bacterium]